MQPAGHSGHHPFEAETAPVRSDYEEVMLNASSISVVLDAYRPERAALVGLLKGLSPGDWARSTECPIYSIKGITTHILGDDLSLLSRQRDCSEPGTSLVASELLGADFRALLDAFNDRWVAAATFLSTEVLVELLAIAGEWTALYYEDVDPEMPGEPVRLFGGRQGSGSPFWHAIAREYLERWIHHSQIRRALNLGALAERSILEVGIQVVAAIGRVEPGIPVNLDGVWTLGPVTLGPAQQTADILTRGFTAQEIQQLTAGPSVAVTLMAELAGRP